MPKLWSETVESHRLEVREAILDAAGDLVMSRGLLAVSMSAVAEATGIGRATLYKYFPDAEDVLTAWHERHVSSHLAAMTALRDRGGGTPSTRLRKVLVAYGHICQQRRRHGAGELAGVLHRTERVQALHRQLVELVAELASAAAREGAVRDDVPAQELAAFAIHALGAADDVRTDAALKRLVDLVWSGLTQPVNGRPSE
jgi:AcrR family transcriptional regulator